MYGFSSTTSLLSIFVCLAALAGCSGTGAKTAHSEDVKCPVGQTFDGQYCRVDQSVATVEVPTSESETSRDGQPKREGEEAEDLPSEPSEASEDEEGEVSQEAAEVEAQPADQELEPAEPEHATPVDYAMAAQAGPVMQYLARSHLPSGARPVAPPFAGQFAEGQILEQKLQLVEGKCYTVVGLALPPMIELDIELYADSDSENPLATDPTTGAQSVLGSRSECFEATEGGPARLVLRAKKGGGVAAAQVFSK